jgi:hypothetical protein
MSKTHLKKSFVLLVAIVAAVVCCMLIDLSIAQDKPSPKDAVKKDDAKKEAAEIPKRDLVKRTTVDKGLLAGGPIRSGHITVFPLYYKDKQETLDVLCLAEAVENKSFIVNEKGASGQVSGIRVKNNSGKPVLLLSGEVIFGGKQDRIIAVDTLIPAKKDEEFTVKVFCVEHGRWNPRKPPSKAAGQFSCGNKKTCKIVGGKVDEKPVIILEEEDEITKDVPKGTSWDNLSNKNLGATSNADASGFGGGASGKYGQRWGKGALVMEGGGPVSESGVTAALRWLHFHRGKDGSISTKDFAANCKDEKQKCTGAATEKRDVQVTAIALLANLGNGQTHRIGVFKKTVRGFMRFLKSRQAEDGSFTGKDAGENFVTHAMAATAVSEAYAMTGDEALKAMALKALKHTLGCQKKDSGWGCTKDAAPDTPSTGWGVIALKTAKAAGLDVPAQAFMNARKYFDQVTDGSGWTAMSASDKDKAGLPRGTAIALISRIFSGQKASDAIIKKGAALLAANLPARDKDAKKVDFEYWFWGAYSMFQIGKENWQKWNTAQKNAILKFQKRGGCSHGSWDAAGEPAKSLGRAGVTAYAALTLEIYYRYSRAGHASLSRAPAKPNTQSDIWKGVAQMNKKLGTTNSTQTFRENRTTKKAADKTGTLMAPFAKAFMKDEAIIGFACAINGEILFIDLFCDRRLAGVYKYRLLKSYVLEGLNRGDKSTGIKVDAGDLADFITQGNKGDIKKSESAHNITNDIQTTGGVLRTDLKLGDKIIRRAYYKLER